MRRAIAMGSVLLLASALSAATIDSPTALAASPQCKEGKFDFAAPAKVRYCVDPDAQRFVSMTVFVNGHPMVISDHDDKSRKGIEIDHRITLTFNQQYGRGTNQLPIRVFARWLLVKDTLPTAAPNFRKPGDALFAWDEWNDFKCPQRSLEVNDDHCWFHQTGWKDLR